MAVHSPPNGVSTWVGYARRKQRLVCLNLSICRTSSSQASITPSPCSLPPSRRARQSQTETAPNFDSFVTTVPARLSQAVQTEAIYRSVGDTDTHTMTHTRDPHSPRPTSAKPWIQTPGHKWSPAPREMHTLERGTQTWILRCKKTRKHTLFAQTAAQTQRQTRQDPETQTRTLQTHANPLTQNETHSATHTPDTHQEPQTPRRPDSVSHTRHPPTSTPSQS